MPTTSTFDASQENAKINITRKEDGKTFITFVDDAGNEQRVVVGTHTFDDTIEPYAVRLAEGAADGLLNIYTEFESKVRKQMAGVSPLVTEFAGEVRKAANIKRRRTEKAEEVQVVTGMKGANHL